MTEQLDVTEIQAALAQLIGKPAWSATVGFGSFLTIEFGAEGAAQGTAARKHGEYHLWIYCTAWRLERTGALLAGSEDARADLERAAGTINGLTAAATTIEWPSLSLTLTFSDGLKLRTFSVFTQESEHWMLYMPDGRVFTAGPGSTWSVESKQQN